MIFQEIVLHDFSRPLRARLESRKFCGPYHWCPSDAREAKPRGFYMASKGLACAQHGASFDLRLSLANDHLSDTWNRATGYYCDEFQDETLKPIVARLPHGRGFLAGWTMGASMCATIARDIYDTPEDAARAAHSMAEYDAEQERNYQEREREQLAEDERAAEAAEIDEAESVTE